MRKLGDQARADAIVADLGELERLRRYLVFGRKDGRANVDKLVRAIDDYVEEMTGDRTKLHARGSSIGA
ncbi:hypothetical protein QRQ56_30995 [Bradyrhizobium sp. U531]|uniref:hypothetical protein n=1 Tax=Bradyrhizobium sp. U531 TaxID=3053458 RepID=UPI003F438B70